MTAEPKLVPEPPPADQELELELEPAPEVEQALPEAAPRLLLPPSGSKHPALHELSWLASQLRPPDWQPS